MLFSRRLLATNALLLTAFLLSCDSPTRPPTEGSIRPRIELYRDTLGLFRVVQPFTTVLATVSSGTFFETVILTSSAAGWRGTIEGLAPGAYTVSVTGLVGDSVQHFGQTSVNVVAGPPAQPPLQFHPLAPVLANPPSATTNAFSATISFAAVPGATGYVVQASQSPTFGLPIIEATAATPTITLQLNATGTWYYRARPTLPIVGASPIRFSDPKSFEIEEATGGRDAGNANATNLVVGTPGTIADRNITADETEDWFTLPDLKAGDTLRIEAIAAGLTPPSPLNTRLTLYRQDQLEVVADSNDSPGLVGGDARIRLALEHSETYYAKVTSGAASGNAAVGHYEFRYLVRRNPAAPTAFAAVATGATSAALSWIDNASVANGDQEAGYEIWRCKGVGCSDFALVTTTAADAQAHAYADLELGATYAFRIRARQDDQHHSAYSPTITVSLAIPATPTDLVATTTSATRVDLEWTDNATTETAYAVERCTGVTCGDADFAAIVDTLAVGTEAFADSTVTYGNVYRYRVRALSAAGASVPSNIADASTEPPGTPTALTGIATAPNQIEVSWIDNANNELGFYVERCAGATCTDFALVGSTGANNTTFVDTPVAFDADYRYRVRAYHVITSQTYSNIADVNTRPAVAPSGLVATVAVGAVQLAWLDNAADETLVEIERCAGAGCTFTLLATLVGENHIAHVDNAVVANESYAYRVRVRNPAGFSTYSNEAGVLTTLATAPTGLSATTVSGSRIDLAWTDNANGETGYVIERCTGDGCDAFVVLDTVAVDAQAFSDETVTVGESYAYRVSAAAAFGNSSPSNVAVTTTRVPDAPTDLVANTLSNSSIELDWVDAATNESQYTVERCDGPGCTDFVAVATLPAGTTSFLDTGLASNEEYSYRVLAGNVVGSSAPSNIAIATTNLPAIPTDLAAEVTGANAVRITWVDNAGDELDQRVERCEHNGGPACTDFVEIAVVGTDVVLFAEGGLNPSTTYRYRVRARNGAGYSDYSNIVSITAGRPALATALSATTVSPTRIDLAWSDGSDNERRFFIERCTGDGCASFALYDSTAANVSTYMDLDVVAAEFYRYRVIPVNDAGTALAYTNQAAANTMPPDAPTGFTATTISSVRIDLSWTDGGPYETGYEIERCVGNGCTNFTLLFTTGADVEAFEDDTLTSGLTYRYRVRAVNAAGVSAYAGPVDGATNLPADPTDLTAVAASPTSVALTWTDNATNETGYLVERCTGDGCGSFTTLTLLAGNVESFTDATVVYGETYRYRVQAVGIAGSSQFTPIATVVIIEPETPTDFGATTTSGTSITLAWTDASPNEVDFAVERCTGDGCSTFAQIAVVAANASGYVDASVVLNETYVYRIRARNNVGNSPYTTEATANTILPADPADLVATTVSSERIDLSWTDNATNEGGYRIERCVGAGCGTFTLLAETGADAVAYEDANLTPEESYTYRITAFNVAGTSATIGPVTATTILPLAPSTLTATVISSSAINLVWVDDAINEAGYRIERCSGIGCSNFVEIGTVGPGVTTFPSLGLVLNSFYSHRVRAFNAAGTSAYSPVAVSNTFAPGAPSGLSASTLTASSVSLTWSDNSGNEDGFRVERCEGAGCSDFIEVATVGQNTQAYTDPDAPVGVAVSYRVRAFNGVGSSTYTAVASVSTLVPATPSALVAVAQGQVAIQLTWTDNATDEAEYRIERCTGAGCTDFTLLTTLPANTALFTDGTVAAGTAYRYRVAAAGNGRSDYSNIASATTILPAAPSGLVATAVSDDRVDLTWVDNADNETGVRIERCAGADCTATAEIAIVGADVTTYSDLSVTAGGIYRYVIRAINDAGESAPSDTAETATNVPGLPTGLTATVISATQIDLAWTDNATTETGYAIERCTGTACTDFEELTVLAANEETFADATVIAATTYRYRVRAVNANGTSGYTNIATAATNAPTAPSGLTAVTFSATQVNLSWTDEANNESWFEVERCTGAACAVFARIDSLGPDAAGYADVTVTLGNSYTYRVRAMNAAGASPYTAEATATTFVPAAPTTLTATTISATRIDLAWTDNADNESAVRVERCTGAACTDFALVVERPANATAHIDEGLTAGLLYRYRIVMTNAAGASPESNEAEASTDFPLPPTALVATTFSATRIDLVWTDNSGNEDGFQIERCDGEDCSEFALLETVGADVATYADETTTLGNSYSYRVRAVNFAGASDFTMVATATTFVPADPVVAGVVATSATSARLTWTAQANTSGYIVERCDAADCEFAVVADLPHPTALYDDAALTAGLTYRYRISAYNAAGGSGYSGEVTAPMLPPAAISGVVGFALSGTQAFLTWVDNADDETLVRVQRCSGAGCAVFSTIATLGANVIEYQDDGLAPAGVYTYRLLAENAVGASVPSGTVQISLNAPEAPSALIATTTGPGVISLAWNDNSLRELQYAIERCTGLLCLDFVQVALVGENVTAYENTGLDLNAMYRYRVRALNNIGPSPYSNIATANTLLPAAATGLVATTIHGERIDLSWTDNATNESGFRIQRCVGVGCSDFVQVAAVPANAVAFSHVTDVLYGNVYSYRVVATNISGDAAPSNVSTASTALPAPSPVTATTLNRTNVRIDWSDLGLFETGYEVFRCEGPGCSTFAPVGFVGGAVNTFTDTGLPGGSEFSYQVRATTTGGASAFSVRAIARTPIDVAMGALLSGVSDANQGRRHWVVTVPSGVSELRVQMVSGGGDPDMYVRRGAAATVTGFFASDSLCSNYTGSPIETCVFTNPAPGDWFIMLHAFSTYSATTIAVNVQYQFATCGAVGQFGPTQGQCNTAYTNSTLQGDVTLSDGIQTWTVPHSGTYEIQAVGAQGASATAGFAGGRGAVITGTFTLTAGQTLKLAVGQMGLGQGGLINGGGGGGSFVVDAGDNPLLVAGGGGGTRVGALQAGCNASLTNFGVTGSFSSSTGTCTIKATGLGAGGAISISWGSAGAGFFGNGADDAPYGTGGLSWGNGLLGGGGPVSGCSTLAVGGFGGGGAGNGCFGGGGGGGYSGGDGGWIAGGGGSYNTGSSPTAVVSPTGGHGSIRIRWVGP